MKRFASIAAFLACTVPATFALTATAAENDIFSKLNENKSIETKDLIEIIKQQQQQIKSQETLLKKLQNSVESLSVTSQKKTTPTTTEDTKQATSNAASTTPSKTTKNKTTGDGTQQVGLERRPIPKKQPTVIAAAPKNGGVLLSPGSMVLEPSIEYGRSSALRVAVEGFTIIPALNIGSIDISQVDRDTITTALGARLGLFDRFEIATRIPFLYRDDSTFSRPIGEEANTTTQTNISGEGLGDVEVSAHYQINDGSGGWPFFIGNLRFKSRTGTDPFEVSIDPNTGLQNELPTGSGFYALQPSITAIIPSDPVVMYGTLGYMHNFARDLGGAYGEIDPGDSINFALGMGFSINERTSFSLGYSHDMVFQTKQNGLTIPGSDQLQVGQFSTGVAYKYSNKVNLNFSLSAGLTDDAPDMRAMFKVPVKLDLW